MAHNTNHLKKSAIGTEANTQARFTTDLFDSALMEILGGKPTGNNDPSLKVRVFNIVIDGDGRAVNTR